MALNTITIKYEVRQGHRPVYPCKWSIDKEKTQLIQTISLSIDQGMIVNTIKSTFFSGDNIKLDEEEYHIRDYRYSTHTLDGNYVNEVVIIYNLAKGRYSPPEWIEIGVIEDKGEV